MAKSPEELAHLEWLGYVQPVGLVVSIPALLEAQCYVNKNVMGEHARFLGCLATDDAGEMLPEVRDLSLFTQQALDWQPQDLIEVPKSGALAGDMVSLEVILPQYNETLRPTHVVVDSQPPTINQQLRTNNYILLIQELASGVPLDQPQESDSAKHWNAPPHAKFERLLRESGVPIGLLFNRRQFRLVYAPRGETSGYATFNVDEMAQVAGRPMFAAFQMLLGADRLFNLADSQRLPHILANSRKYQNVVSTALAEQVTSALFELLRGFQAANDQRSGELLRQVLANNPQHVYHGLLTVLMRLVFVLYAEDRGLVSSEATYTNHYSVSGLFERLRSEAGRFPDTMDQRFGAWAQLLTLFRLVYEGGQHGELKIPARKGYLFDPDRYPFLEGRVECGEWSVDGGGSSVASGGRVKDEDSKLSRSGSLAEGDGSRGRVLSSDEAVSEGGAIRHDQSDSQGSGIDTGEYSRGTGTAGNQRVSEFLGDSAGLAYGSGDASDPLSKSRLNPTDRFGKHPIPDRPNQQNVGRPAKVARSEGGEGRVKSGKFVEGGEGRVESGGIVEPETHLTPPTTHHPPLSPHHSPLQIPRVSDGTVYRVLEDLLILDGERLSYRTLDVEQIGSVYEAIMGFELQVSAGKSIGIKPVKSHGAPATINLEALLAAKPADRSKLLKEWTDQKLSAGDAATLKDATSIDELVAALEKKIAKHVTPGIVPADSMVFQPSDERRRSGSHYTPRSLTQPIVRTTLEPILKQLVTHPDDLNHRDTETQSSTTDSPHLCLRASVVNPRPIPKELQKRLTKGEIAERERIEQRRASNHTAAIEKRVPHPNQILDLKVCDPAMGSGAFLVETCRQLGDELIKSWYAHDLIPMDIPPDEDEVLYARRTVAQRCLYGVDKNIMAVDLAKLSLWLVTLAKDHPFTFLDHAMRHGDSLVGLTREQIVGFHWEPKKQKKFGEDLIQKRLDRATEARAKILSAREDVAYRDQEQRMAVANEALNLIRLVGNACVSCFFAGDKKKAREEELERVFGLANAYLEELNAGKLNHELRQSLVGAASTLHTSPNPLHPFHWEIEFPEVFSRENGGFDAFVGNPPFLGGLIISTSFGSAYIDWMLLNHVGAHGRGDIAAHFFRRAFSLTRKGGTVGLIATNSIAQGDTRITGLGWLCANGAFIYNARRRIKWPGQAAVVVSVIHLIKETRPRVCLLDEKKSPKITAFLFGGGGNADPYPLKTNDRTARAGVYVLGAGFVFKDNDVEATPIAEMNALIAKRPENRLCIFPFMGGKELNSDPQHNTDRWIINFGDQDEETVRTKWPEPMAIVETKVRPQREIQKNPGWAKNWWRFGGSTAEIGKLCVGLDRVLVMSTHSTFLSFAFCPCTMVFGHSVNLFAIDTYAAFCSLQSRPHEVWSRFFASSLEDRLRYATSDCFDTFPFAASWKQSSELEVAGREYYLFRANLMISNEQGMTSTYNRFHDPNEQSEDITDLRRLHGLMDGAVLQLYGWDDLAACASKPNFCEFLLEYEEEDDDESLATGSLSRRSNRKKPWRYRWPDDFRDEVLARLLELNEQRHREELLVGSSQLSVSKTEKKANKPKTAKGSATPLLDGLDQVELGRDERLLLLIVNSFKLITRTAVDEAFIAMKYPKLRKSRLGLSDPPKSVPRTDAGRDALIGGLVDRGFLEKHPSDHQQVWKLGASAPSLAATAAERKALEETKAIFQKSINANDDLASCKEGVTDAKPGLVSIA